MIKLIQQKVACQPNIRVRNSFNSLLSKTVYFWTIALVSQLYSFLRKSTMIVFSGILLEVILYDIRNTSPLIHSLTTFIICSTKSRILYMHTSSRKNVGYAIAEFSVSVSQT